MVFIIFAEKSVKMTIVSCRDFRSNQGKYLELAAKGENVILTSRSGNFRIVPVSAGSTTDRADYIERLADAAESLESGGARMVADAGNFSIFSTREPSDCQLDMIMSQVKESAIQATGNAERILAERLEKIRQL